MITIEELREHVPVNPDHDHELELIRSAVIGMWERVTGRPWSYLAGDVIDVKPDSERQNTIFLPRLPVSAVTTIRERYVGSTTWTTLVEDTDYFVVSLARGKIERLNYYWSENIEVTYTGGYDETTAPAEVRNALLLQARFMIERYDGEKLVTTGQAVGKTNVMFEAADMHPHFKRMAKMLRRPAY